MELDAAKFRAKRERALNQVTLLTDDAVATLGEMMRDASTPPAVRAKLIDMVLTKVIISEKPDAVGGDGLTGLPAPDASEEEKVKWLSQRRLA